MRHPFRGNVSAVNDLVLLEIGAALLKPHDNATASPGASATIESDLMSIRRSSVFPSRSDSQSEANEDGKERAKKYADDVVPPQQAKTNADGKHALDIDATARLFSNVSCLLIFVRTTEAQIDFDGWSISEDDIEWKTLDEFEM